MQLAFITDLHFGIKNNSEIFLNNIRDYLYNEFIPEVKARNIETVVIGGDVFDSRNNLNVRTLNYAFDFFKKMEEEKLRVVVIAGNHDLYLSTSNDYTSLPFVENFKNVTLVKSGFQSIDIEGNKIMFMAWIPNIEKFISDTEILKKYPVACSTCIGHFPFIGFRMNKSSKIMDEGMPDTVLPAEIKTLISGHYHMRSEKTVGDRAIFYTGSPYQLTWADAEEDRGFTVFTFDKGQCVDHEYVNNKHCIRFVNLVYPNEFTEEQVKGNIINICVDYSEKFDEVKLDEYKNRIMKFSPAYKPEIQIVNQQESDFIEKLDEFSAKTTIDLINEYIDQANIENKDGIREEILGLYNQVKKEE